MFMASNSESFTSFCKNFTYKKSNLYDYFKDYIKDRPVDFDALENYKVTEKFRKDFEDMIVGKGAKITGDDYIYDLLYYISLKVKSPSFPSFHGCSYVKEFRVGRICRNAIRIPICIGKSAKYFVGVVAHQDEGGETKYFKNCDVYAKNNGLNEKLGINEDVNLEELETITYVYPRDIENITKLSDSDEGYQNVNFEIEEGTTRISSWAFVCNMSIFEIDIPGSVEVIGESAFQECTNLSSVKLHEGLVAIIDFAFAYCTSLTSIDIPSSVKVISRGAFFGCDNLHEITYDNHTFDSVDSFIEYFNSKNRLQEDLENNDSNFEEFDTITYTFPRDWRKIRELNDSEEGYQNINFEIAEGTTKISSWAFYGNLSIFEIDIPGSVKEIGYDAFYKCTNLSSVELHEGLVDIDDYAFYECSSLTSIDIPKGVVNICHGAFAYCNNLSSVTLHEGIDRISNFAFSICTSLTSINIPSSVRIIHNNTFFGCDNLHEITYDNHTFDSVSSFIEYFTSKQILNEDLENSTENNIEEMETVTYVYPIDWEEIKELNDSEEEYQNINFEIESGTTIIEDWAFENNLSIFEIDIPSSVKEIAESAFDYCTNLSAVTLHEGLESIDSCAFQDCKSLKSIDIPSSVKIISRGAFANCNNLASVTLHEGIMSIDDYAFQSCKSLTSVDIPSSVKEIGANAFAYCDNLSTVTFHEGLETIAWYAFDECNSLTSINIPTSVKKIESSSFNWCNNLHEITYDNHTFDSVDSFMEYFYSNQNLNEDLDNGDNNIEEMETVTYVYPIDWEEIKELNGSWEEYQNINFEIESGTVKIEPHTFFCNPSIFEIDIPSSVKEIGKSAFDYCTNLSAVTLHEGLESIDSCAFQDCKSLTSIDIPSSVKEIGESAFEWCTNLSSVKLHEGLVDIDNFAFYECRSLTSINIPISVKYIRIGVFGGCDNLHEITYDNQTFDSVKSFREYFNSKQNLQEDLENNEGNIEEIEDVTYVYPRDRVSIKKLNNSGEEYQNINFEIEDGTTKIMDWTFENSLSIFEIDIPSSVKDIGCFVFNGCVNLSLVTLHEGLEYIGMLAFSGCESLHSIHIPSSVKSISMFAFSDCDNLHEITYDNHTFDSVKSFMKYFNSKRNLTEDLENNESSIEEMETVTYVYPRDKEDIKKLNTSKEEYQNISFEIEDGITEILDGAFKDNLSIFDINIPSSVKEIGQDSFHCCTNLSSVTLHEGLKEIGDCAFMSCKSLTSIDIPSSVKEIDVSAFEYCTNLSSVTLHEGLEKIDNYDFYECRSLKSIDIPSSVKEIGESAFEWCTNLSSVKLHEGLVDIDDFAFSECRSLASINIPISVKYIRIGVFDGCDNLHEITYDNHTFDSVKSFMKYFNSNQNLNEDLDNSTENNVEEMETVTYVYPRDKEDIKKLNTSKEEYQNINFEIEEGITEISEGAFNWNSSLFEIDIPSSVKEIGHTSFYSCTNLSSVTLHEGLKEIGNYAFAYCTSLTSIDIPSSVRTISQEAFSHCDNLSSVTLSEGLEKIVKGAFSYSSLTAIDIPSSVKEIGYSVFANCYKLSSVTLHEGLRVISKYCFYKCESLTSIDIPSSIKEIGESAFAYCDNLSTVTLHEGLETIAWYAFDECNSLTSINIPISVKYIRIGVFGGCDNLHEITYDNHTFDSVSSFMKYFTSKQVLNEDLDNSAENNIEEIEDVTYVYPIDWEEINELNVSGEEYQNVNFEIESGTTIIEDWAFENNLSIFEIDIPSSVKEIGESAFAYCDNLSTVTFHEGLESIDSCAFQDCKSLKSIDIPSSVKVISQEAFFGCPNLSSVTLHEGLEIINSHAFQNCKSLTSIDIPSSVKKIDVGAFAYCDNLSTVTFHEGLESIDSCAFQSCKSLTSIDIPSSVKKIGANAFAYCDNLSTVTLHEGLKDIDDYAFINCTSLTSINIPISVKYIRIGVFDGCDNLHEITYDNHTFDSVKSFMEYFESKQNLNEDLENSTENNIEEMETVTYVYPRDRVSIRELNESGEEYQNINFEIEEGTARILDEAFMYNMSIFEIDIPSSVKKIAESAFDYCTNLSSVTLHEGLESIDDYAFYECRSLKSIDIPSSVVTICHGAFSWCTNLSSVTLHEGLKDIGDCAFINCKSLTAINIPNSVEYIYEGSFQECDNLHEITYDNQTFDSINSFMEYFNSKQNLQEDLENNDRGAIKNGK